MESRKENIEEAVTILKLCSDHGIDLWKFFDKYRISRLSDQITFVYEVNQGFKSLKERIFLKGRMNLVGEKDRREELKT